MKIYLSSLIYTVLKEISARIQDNKPNVLLSYGVQKNDDFLIMDRMRHLVDSLILDSGTFSLHTEEYSEKEKITLPGYSDYLSVCGKYFDFYFNFDKNFTIKGFEENLECLKHLEKKGHKPVPVVHDYYREEIDYYINNGYDLVALGSVMAPGKKDFLRSKDDIYHAVERLIKHNIKIHVFASATYNMLHDIPVYSSDASSWAQHAAAGKILFWNENNPGEDKTDLIRMFDYVNLKEDGNFFFKEYPFRRELEEHLDSMGIIYEDLMGKDMSIYRQFVNCAYYLKLEKILTIKHKEKGFPF